MFYLVKRYGDTSSRRNLSCGRRLMIVPVIIIYEADNPVHIVQISVFHVPLLKSGPPRSVLLDYSIAHFFGISRASSVPRWFFQWG